MIEKYEQKLMLVVGLVVGTSFGFPVGGCAPGSDSPCKCYNVEDIMNMGIAANTKDIRDLQEKEKSKDVLITQLQMAVVDLRKQVEVLELCRTEQLQVDRGFSSGLGQIEKDVKVLYVVTEAHQKALERLVGSSPPPPTQKPPSKRH